MRKNTQPSHGGDRPKKQTRKKGERRRKRIKKERAKKERKNNKNALPTQQPSFCLNVLEEISDQLNLVVEIEQTRLERHIFRYRCRDRNTTTENPSACAGDEARCRWEHAKRAHAC